MQIVKQHPLGEELFFLKIPKEVDGPKELT